MQKSYDYNLKEAIAAKPSFNAIYNYNVAKYEKGWYETHREKMANGTGLTTSSEEAITYIAAYGIMHQTKLNLAFRELFAYENFNGKITEIIDWGCGQAVASCVLLDYVASHGINIDLKRITLIEPSSFAINRGVQHINAIYSAKLMPETVLINEYADNNILLEKKSIKSEVRIHLFSNILDLQTLNLNMVYNNVNSNFEGINYFVCVGPINSGTYKLLNFYNLFKTTHLICNKSNKIMKELFRPSQMANIVHRITNYNCIFKAIL